jgi:hypothetical protein
MQDFEPFAVGFAPFQRRETGTMGGIDRDVITLRSQVVNMLFCHGISLNQ